MFGFVIANLDQLIEEERRLYRATYCGLCRALGSQHGQSCRMTLTYDMTFLILLLSSLADEEPAYQPFRCAMPPFKPQESFTSQFTPDGADMNLLLAHAQRLDDWQDDRKLLSLAQARMLGRNADALRKQYPRQAGAIDQALKDLQHMEAEGQSNPDLPAKAFGSLLAAIFVPDEGMQAARELGALGYALGRFIYLMDAAVDLVKDLKRERYNPLITIPSEEHEPLLRLLMSECAACFELLPIRRNRPLLENILYSGVWTQLTAKQQKEAAKQ